MGASYWWCWSIFFQIPFLEHIWGLSQEGRSSAGISLFLFGYLHISTFLFSHFFIIYLLFFFFIHRKYILRKNLLQIIHQAPLLEPLRKEKQCPVRFITFYLIGDWRWKNATVTHWKSLFRHSKIGRRKEDQILPESIPREKGVIELKITKDFTTFVVS